MSEEPRQPRRRKRGWLSGCVIVMASGLLMLVIAWLLIGVLSDRGTEALRAKGYPTTLDELNDWYVEPPPGQNAADYYLEAATLLEHSTFPELAALPIQGDAELPPLGTPVSEEMRAVIGAYLAHESRAFELIDEASEFPEVRFPARFNLAPGGMLLPHLKTIRNGVRGQYLRTIHRSGCDDTDGALEAFDQLVQVARSLRDEPILISQMVHVAMVRMACGAAERILNENTFTYEQWSTLDASLARLLDDDALLRALVGERCFTSAGTAQIPGVGRFFRAEYRATFDGFVALAEVGLPTGLDAYRASLDRKYSAVRPFSASLAPSLIRSLQSYYEHRALVSAARAAVAIQQSRLEGAPLPDSIEGFSEAVGGAWPIDPFSGKPFVYKRLDEGFVVYSVGGDLNDDGGVAADAAPDGHHGGEVKDVVFRVLR